MKPVPICSACLLRPSKPAGCSNTQCPHHHRCAFCGRRTDGRFLLVGEPALGQVQRRTGRQHVQ